MRDSIISKIKNEISCISYMQRIHNRRVVNGRCRSFRADAKNNTTLMVNERDWYDFGTGIGGDIIDLAAHDKFSGNKGQAIVFLAEQWGIQGVVTPHIDIIFKSYLEILDQTSKFYQSCLEQHHLNYLRGRGLTDKTIKELRIGWSGNPCEYLQRQGFTMQQISDSGVLSFVNRLMIPYMRNGKTIYMIGRQSEWDHEPSSIPDAKYTKLYRNEYSDHPIWGFETLSRPGRVIIAEGIFDAISCWQENYPVVTAVTGAFSSTQKEDLIPALKNRDVLICMDYDPETHAGQKFTETLAKELFNSGISVSVCLLDGDKSKLDISSCYAMHPCRETLEKIFADAQPWERVYVERIGSLESEKQKREELAKFLRGCAKNFDGPTVAQIIQDILETGLYSPVWLKEFAKTLTRAPKEITIVHEFKEKHDYVYHISLGWYHYDKTCWQRTDDLDVKQKIADLLGQFRSSKLVDSIYKLLKSELAKKDLFNSRKDLLNFPNGMLNLKTGELLPHSRDYFSSIQMSYSYDPASESKNWQSFIEDVTGGDLNRYNLLQEMFGYCLLQDARFQKAFCLMGDGANGKSVLLNVLENLVGSNNTSHVEIAFLQSGFERIGLMNSFVNICNDMKSDVSGTESFFKAIVAGDPISGCYKGKDFVTFKPFCKMIFSTNHMPTAKEVDHSFLRRFCFINFPVTFTDHPNEDNEKKIDRGIQSRLLQDLPGIFNWAYTGYRHLLENKEFTETWDQNQMLKELFVLNNPLVSFVEDVIGNGGVYYSGRCSKTDIYSKYDQWCRQTNTRPMSARSFWPRLKKVYPYREYRTSDGRFVEFTKSKKYCSYS